MSESTNQITKLIFKEKIYEVDFIKNEIQFENKIIAKLSSEVISRKKQIYFKFNSLCNLKCTYCYQCGEDSPNIKLKDSDWEIIDELICEKNSELVLFGGEPLIEQNYENLLTMFNKLNHKKIKIFTNCSYDSVYNEFLSRFVRNIETIIVTLDGPEYIHNQRRISKDHCNGYRRIIRNLTYYKDNGLPFLIQINVDKNNVVYIEELIQELKENFDLTVIKLILNRVLHTFSMIDDYMYLNEYIKLKNAFPYYNIDINYPVVEKIRSFLGNKGLIDSRCGAGKTEVYDFSIKTIYTCPEASNINVGSFKHDEINIDYSVMNKISNYIKTNTGKCKFCIYSKVCKYGCYKTGDKMEFNCYEIMKNELNHILEHYDQFALTLNK